MKKTLFVCIILFFSFEIFAQKKILSVGQWNLTSINGHLKGMGQYRDEKTVHSGISQYLKSNLYRGGILLNTKSYVWHPNFMLLNLGLNYNPESYSQNYLVMPDQAEVNTMQEIDIATTFFNDKPVTVSFFTNFNNNRINREGLSSAKAKTGQWGSTLTYVNKFLPLSFDYRQSKWTQTEVLTNRIYSVLQRNLVGTATKSFTPLDASVFSYTHNEYIWEDKELYSIKNNIDNFRLFSNVYFDEDRNYNYRSTITNNNQSGRTNLNHFNIDESFTLLLPKRFTVLGNYGFSDNKQNQYELKQHRVRTTVKHQLFLSLSSAIFFDYGSSNHTLFDEKNTVGGINFKYSKLIPKGKMILTYNYSRRRHKTAGEPTPLQILMEEHKLTDGALETLSKPDVYFNDQMYPIVVKDGTGTIEYTEGIDYSLDRQGEYIQITRIPGGAISNNQTVYIDYFVRKPGTYQYDANIQGFNARFIFFKRLLEFYFIGTRQDIVNSIKTEYITLNNFTKNLIGIRLDVKYAKGGIEWDRYESPILPYKMTRYFITVQWNWNRRVLCSLNGNIRDYLMLTDSLKQQYSDISGRVAYQLEPKTKVQLSLGYRKQVGKDIDLDFLTSRTEFTTTIRQMFFTVGVEYFQRLFRGTDYKLKGAYARILRKF